MFVAMLFECPDFCGLIFRFGALHNENTTQRKVPAIWYLHMLIFSVYTRRQYCECECVCLTSNILTFPDILSHSDNVKMSVEVIKQKKQAAYVSHVEKSCTFFLQLDTKEASTLNELSDRIAAHVMSAGSQNICPAFGLKCFARSNIDNVWYRALIAGVDGSTVIVFFVDYGNTESVSFHQLRDPVDSFFNFPYQSVCCTTANFISRQANFGSKLKSLIIDREMCCEFLSNNKSKGHPFLRFLPCYNVLLYESMESDITLAEFLIKKNLGKYAICADSAEIDTQQNVVVSFVDSPGKFWIQLSKNAKALELLTIDLNSPETVRSLVSLPDSSIDTGIVCGALYTEDLCFYRAEISSRKSNTKVNVWFGDYGNSQVVAAKDLKILPPRFTRIPFCALMCSLDGVLPVRTEKPHPKLGSIAWTPEASKSFSSLVLEEEFEAHFVNELSPEVYTVHLIDLNTGIDVKTTLANSEIVELSVPNDSPFQDPADFENLSLNVGEAYKDVFISHVESPGVVWCQLPKYQVEMESLTAALESVGPTLPALDDIDVGVPCCAHYSVDNAWYRGTVESVDFAAGTAQVLFVDYGNSEEVQFTSLKALSNDYFALPAQAISFSVGTIVPSEGDWSEEACDSFVNLVYKKVLNCTVVCLDVDGYPSVDLCDPLKQDESIAHHLIQQGSAVKVLPTLSSGSQPPLNVPKQELLIDSLKNETTPVEFEIISLGVGKMYENVLITNVESPAVVWCQLPKYQKEMKALTTALKSVGPTLPALDDIEIGVPCCAQYSVDNAWYRGTIESVNSTAVTAQVLFVDYGNSEEVPLSSLKVLSRDYFALPAQAISFSVSTIAPSEGDWSEEACDSFVNLVYEKVLNCTVVCLDVDGYPSVDLCDPLKQDESIARHLIQQGLAVEVLPTLSSDSQPTLDVPKQESMIVSEATPVEFKVLSLEVGKSYQHVFITHVESPAVVWCQLPKFKDEVESLTAALESVGPTLPALDDIDVGVPCCAQYSVDNAWYRGTIESVNFSVGTAQVLFVDYGNSEEVQLTSLKALSSDYFVLPAQAISFSVAPSEGDWSEEACDSFVNLIHEKALDFTVIQLDADGYPSVKLCNPLNSDQDVAHELVRGCALQVHAGEKINEPITLLKPPSLSQLLDFEFLSLEVGKSYQNVFISHVESPAVIWCQLPKYQDKLESLTAALESVGPTLSALDDIDVGVPCCAQYSVDNAWYRGTIESVDYTAETAQVLFVDYGNSEEVQLTSLKALSSDYFALPAQAVSFSMAGLIPRPEWSKDSCECFMQLVQERQLNCDVIELGADGYPSVLLFDPLHPTNEIGQELVCRGYAKNRKHTVSNQDIDRDHVKRVSSGADLSNISPKKVAEQLSLPLCYNTIDLKIGSTYSVLVCHVESLNEFYCQLTESFSDLKDLMENIYTHCESSCSASHGDIPIVNQPIIATFSEDGNWYRALVREIESKTSAVVKFVDYGNSESVSFDSMKKLTENFVKLPCQAIQCSLFGAHQIANTPSDTDTKFINLAADCHFMLSVNDIGKDRQIVADLKCEDGTTITEQLFDSRLPNAEVHTIPPPIFTVNLPTAVVPCFVESPHNFYLQLTDNYKQLKEFVDSIDSFYKVHECEVPKERTGCMYAVQFSEDDVWYRARVTVVHGGGMVDVKFVDYGNSETTTMESVRVLHSKFLSTPCFAVPCFLDGLPKDLSSCTAIKAFTAMISDQELVAQFCSPFSGYDCPVAVKLTNKGVSVLSSFTDVLPQEQVMMPKVPSPELNTPIVCVVSFFASCEEFYCQLSSFNTKFNDLMDSLYAFYGENNGTLLFAPTLGSYCAAPFGDDGSWYRGVVTDLSDQSASVFYMDYGNTGEVELSDLMKLEQQFCLLPIQALLCCLPQRYWNAECSQAFQVIFEQSVEVTFIEQLSNGTCMTDVKFDGQNMDVVFSDCSPSGNVASHVCTSMPSTSPYYDPPVPVIVTFVVSCDEFFCQLLSKKSEFDVLMNRLFAYYADGGESRVLASADVGRLCAASFGKDGSWYRAKITAVSGNSVEVLYVDFGNSETLPLSDIIELEPQFCEMPVQALKCCLKNYTHTGSEECLALFQELVLQHEVLAKFEPRVGGDCYSITMLVNGQSMADILIESAVFKSAKMIVDTEVDSPKALLGSLEPDSTYNVLVTVVNSSTEFYCQVKDVEQQLISLMLKIKSFCEQNLPGTEWCKKELVFARFTEDGEWYRAQIMDLNEDSTAKVYYIDYGNFDVVQCTELRKFILELGELPAQAMKCSLESSLVSIYGDYSPDQWSDLLLNQEMTLTCVSVNSNGTHTVTLVDSQLKVDPGIESLKTEVDVLPPNTSVQVDQSEMCPFPYHHEVTLGDSCAMYVSHINSPAQFWLQMPTADDVLVILQNDLAAAYESKEIAVLENPKGACCAKFSEDNCWYRAAVQNRLPEGLEINFVDFGNSEIVDPSQVFELQPEFLVTPVQAIECSLSDIVDTNFSEDILLNFCSLVVNKELSVTFKKQLDISKWKVSLLECGQDIFANLFPTFLPTEELLMGNPLPVAIQLLDISVGETYSVYVSFSDSPSKFFCQLRSECDKLESLMADVCKYYGSNCVEPVLSPGSFCVTQYPDSGSWYRAYIVSVLSNSDIEVNFVDYGNSEHVCANQICALVEKFSLLCAQGIPCSLLHDYSLEFTSDVLQQFFQYDLNQEFKIKIRAHHEDRYIVDLYDQEGFHVNASVLGLLVSPSSVSPVDKQCYTPVQLIVGSTIQAYISHINSPTSFYCQPLKQAAELECLMNEISAISSSILPPLALENVVPGKICLAEFSENNEWYRALVQSINGSDVSVLFVDYGNAEVTSADKLADFPEQLHSHVIQAIHCSVFEGLDIKMVWNEIQTSKFQDLMSQNDHVTMKVTSVSSFGQYVTEVKSNGNSVDFSSLLEQQVEETVPIAPLQPLRSLTAGPTDLIDFSKLTIEGSAASSTSVDTGSEGGDTESDNGSVGKPLIKAPYKLSLAVHESLEVNVVFVHSPSLLYVQRADCKAILESLSEEIEQYCAGFGDSLKEFSPTFHQGDYVLAKYSVDDQWYRAEVTGVDTEDGTTEVSFIDYGNTEVISPDDLVVCPENILELPAQAIPCSLALVPRRDSWPFEYKELLHRLVDDKVLRATVILPASQGMRPTVKLEDEQTNTDISDPVLLKLQEECEFDSNDVITEMPEGEDLESNSPTDSFQSEIPTSTPEMFKVKLCEETTLEVGSTHVVSVVTCNSPHLFYCQLSDQVKILESIVTQLSELNYNYLEDIPKKGDILASRFEDDLWYRARVDTSDSSGMVQVTLIDYGNSHAVTLEKLQFLTKSLLSHPPLAIKCFLAEVCCTEDVLSEDAADKILDLLESKKVNVSIVSVDKTGRHGVVFTTAAGLNVGSALVKANLVAPIAGIKTDFPSSSHLLTQDVIEPFSKEVSVAPVVLEPNVVPTKEACATVVTDVANPINDQESFLQDVVYSTLSQQSSTPVANEPVTLATSNGAHQCTSESQSSLIPEVGKMETATNREGTNTNNNNSEDSVCTLVFPLPSSSLASRHKVNVLHVSSPEDFVCVLTENDNILKQIAAEIADDNYLPVITTPAPSLPVGVFVDKYGGWCRAQVLSVGMSLSMVKVYLVDKGSTDMIPLSHLKPLAMKHIEMLPPQALRCQFGVLQETDLNPNVANVVAQGELWELDWPDCCSKHMQALINDKNGLHIEVCSFRDNMYEVTLLDCSTDPALDVRQTLIEKLLLPSEIHASPLRTIDFEKSFETTRLCTSLSVSEYQDIEIMAVTPPVSPECDLISFVDVCHNEHTKILSRQGAKEIEANTCVLSELLPSKVEAKNPSALLVSRQEAKEIEANTCVLSELLPSKVEAKNPSALLGYNDLDSLMMVTDSEGIVNYDKISENEEAVKCSSVNGSRCSVEEDVTMKSMQLATKSE